VRLATPTDGSDVVTTMATTIALMVLMMMVHRCGDLSKMQVGNHCAQ